MTPIKELLIACKGVRRDCVLVTQHSYPRPPGAQIDESHVRISIDTWRRFVKAFDAMGVK